MGCEGGVGTEKHCNLRPVSCIKKPKWVLKQKYVKVKYSHAIAHTAVKIKLQECM